MNGLTSVTVSLPLTIRRRGGRKQIIGPDGAVARPGDNGASFVPVCPASAPMGPNWRFE